MSEGGDRGMMILVFIFGQFNVEWKQPTFEVAWQATALSGGPSQDAAHSAKDGLLNHPPTVESVGRSKRAAAYRAARGEAELTGRSFYRSEGLPGQALPKGMYELIRTDKGVMYREVEPAGIPIPRPDKKDDGATLRNFRMVEDCIGSA